MFWGEGNKEKYEVAQILRYERLPSESVVYIDSIVTTIMFAKFLPNVQGSRRRIQVLSENSVDENLDEDNQLRMEQLYQAYYKRFVAMEGAAWAAWYMSTTADLASKFWNEFEIVRGDSESDGKMETLKWFATKFPH